jgi:uncharacterized membrane protein
MEKSKHSARNNVNNLFKCMILFLSFSQFCNAAIFFLIIHPFVLHQILATPVLRAASATAAATVLPTRGSKALGMM